MDNSGYNRNRHNEHLGVNKIGKNIRKSPLHQSNFGNPASRQQQQSQQSQQPQVYNINKNDFRNIVQQLTGSPSHHSQEPLLPRPPPPRSPSMRLQRIRPPPLAPISVNRPRMVIPQMPLQHGPRPGPYGGQPPPRNMVQVQPPSQPQPHPPFGSGNYPAESPISSYMRYLEHSINDSPQVRNHMQGQQHQQQSAGLLPFPSVAPLPSPRTNGPPSFLSPRTNGNGNGNGGKGYPPLLPSPTSQFLLPSPSGYLNLSSPRSPYPLLSPGYQRPPPLTPNNPFSPMGQPGILGPGPQPPPSPGVGFPLSPGFFPLSSPRWRD